MSEAARAKVAMRARILASIFIYLFLFFIIIIFFYENFFYLNL